MCPWSQAWEASIITSFALVLDNGCCSIRTMSRVNIDHQPLIKVSGKTDWLIHMPASTYSAEERALDPKKSSKHPSTGWRGSKESLYPIFSGFAGCLTENNFQPSQVFRLELGGVCDLVIFASPFVTTETRVQL